MAENIAFTLLEGLAFGTVLTGNVWLLWRQRQLLWQIITGNQRHLPPPDRPPPEVLLSFPVKGEASLKSRPRPLALPPALPQAA